MGRIQGIQVRCLKGQVHHGQFLRLQTIADQ